VHPGIHIQLSYLYYISAKEETGKMEALIVLSLKKNITDTEISSGVFPLSYKPYLTI